MKLLYLYIENYKMFNKLSVNFFEDDNVLPNYKLFSKMNLTALVGENGVGKTTLMIGTFLKKFEAIQSFV